MVQKLVSHDLIQVGPALGITVEYASDQIPCGIRDIDVVWEGVTVLLDTPVRGFHIGRLEGWFSNYQCVDNDSQ